MGLPYGPVVENLPSNSGYASSIPGQGTKLIHTKGHLSLHVTTREKHAHHNYRSPCVTGKDPTCCNEDPSAAETRPSQKINTVKKEKKFKLIAVSGRVWSRERLESRWPFRQRVS